MVLPLTWVGCPPLVANKVERLKKSALVPGQTSILSFLALAPHQYQHFKFYNGVLRKKSCGRTRHDGITPFVIKVNLIITRTSLGKLTGMGKKTKQYYAIKGQLLHKQFISILNVLTSVGKLEGVYSSWTDCSTLLKGVPNEYAGFNNLEECTQYLRLPPERMLKQYRGPFSENLIAEWIECAKRKQLPTSISSFNSNHTPILTSDSKAISNKRGVETGTLLEFSSNSISQKNCLNLSLSKKKLRINNVSDAIFNKLESSSSFEKKNEGNDLQISETRTKLSTNRSQIGNIEWNLKESSVVKVYVDGCCFGNGQKGSTSGLGVFWGAGNPNNISERLLESEGVTHTNNRAELMAAIRALEVAPTEASFLEIHTDSKYVISGITDYIQNNSWRKGSSPGHGISDRVKNPELWNRLDLLANKGEWENRIRWIYVPGHSGIFGNVEADKLAKLGAAKGFKTI
ncbi:Ribonuclease H1 [Nowakowskiella sp. JEL0078]|nr:Ribonuclease H1 [Nowakowskiella sp. JEL0078]